MKELELTVKIKQVDDPNYPYEITVDPVGVSENPAWCKGKTLQEAMERLYKSFTDSNFRYWHIFKDK